MGSILVTLFVCGSAIVGAIVARILLAILINLTVKWMGSNES